MAALPSPPPAQNKWWKRLQQLTHPTEYQQNALGPHSIVAANKELGLPVQYVLGKAEYVKGVFSGENDGTVTVVAGGILSGRSLLGEESLLLAPEPRHKYLRNLIMPAFSNEAIDKLVPRMEKVLQKYLDKWADAGAPVKAHEQLRMMTFEFIIAVVLGRDYPQETVDYLGSLYRTWAKGLLDWPYLDLPFTGYGRAKKAQRDLYKFFQGCVSEAREQLAHGKSVPGILGSLVAAIDEDGNRLTDSELGDNLLLVLLAGHDTSSSTLTNTMAHLQSNPHVMVQLRAEQQRRCVWPVLSPA
eukprot:GHRR01004070.1.p1 GENE.GHRR01004070.1~~GHRR01004070.1.p1  ORF type:complete len:300 (+),score=122.02 GHRR01004070.1:648-1547(+)